MKNANNVQSLYTENLFITSYNHHHSPSICDNIPTTGKGTINAKTFNLGSHQFFGAWHQHRHQQRLQLSVRRDGSRPCRGEVSSAARQCCESDNGMITSHVFGNIANLTEKDHRQAVIDQMHLCADATVAASSLTWG